MIQKIQIIGMLGKEPVMKTVNDRPCATFPVATSRYLGSDVKPETAWFRVTVYGKSAELIGKMAVKGTKIYCEGRLQVDPSTGGPRIYQRNDGSYGSQFEMVASTVKMISNYKTENQQGQQQAQPAQQQQQTQMAKQQTVTSQNDFDDDIPF